VTTRRWRLAEVMKHKPRCATCGRRATVVHLHDDAPRPYCAAHNPWTERDMAQLLEAPAIAEHDRAFTDLSKFRQRHVAEGWVFHQPHPDEMGPWERIWVAAGYLTEETAPNSFARVRLVAGRPPLALMPRGLYERGDRAEFMRARDLFFEEAIAELCLFGPRQYGRPLHEAWERCGKRNSTTRVLTGAGRTWPAPHTGG
jgi:hypothetical protein